MTSYDAIIVGSGAGGGTAARVLTKRGMRVLVFEKGPVRRSDDFLPYDELHFAEHMALTPSKNTDPLIYIDPAGKRRQWSGGGSATWSAAPPCCGRRICRATRPRISRCST